MDLRQQLIGFEGWKREAYPDPLTKGAPWTIGAGHCGPEVHAGLVWTDAQIGSALDTDIAHATAEVSTALPWSVALDSPPRQAVLIGMAFQMGISRLLRFHHMLAAARAGDYLQAAKEMENSAWAIETPVRAKALAKQMTTGDWHE